MIILLIRRSALRNRKYLLSSRLRGAPHRIPNGFLISHTKLVIAFSYFPGTKLIAIKLPELNELMKGAGKYNFAPLGNTENNASIFVKRIYSHFERR